MSDILDASKTNPLKGGASYSLSHRITRFVWNVVWLVGASWTPPFMRPWRRILLRLFGAKIAPTAGIYGTAKIWYPANLEVGPHAYIGPRVTVYTMAKVKFGAYSLASQGSHICAGTHDIESAEFQLQARPIEIGERAWIAAEAFVGPGVKVGEGAVLGARAVTFSDLEAWGVYAGNPARLLKVRSIRFPNDGH
jgi:putative colanic acid biosynthesis acetyltransferase WcaF